MQHNKSGSAVFSDVVGGIVVAIVVVDIVDVACVVGVVIDQDVVVVDCVEVVVSLLVVVNVVGSAVGFISTVVVEVVEVVVALVVVTCSQATVRSAGLHFPPIMQFQLRSSTAQASFISAEV